MLSHFPRCCPSWSLPSGGKDGGGGAVYWDEGLRAPLKIRNEAITYVLKNGAGRSVSFGGLALFFSLFLFSFFLIARQGTEVENCPGVLLLRFSQELLARDSGSWLGALWPSFYLEAQLRPLPLLLHQEPLDAA